MTNIYFIRAAIEQATGIKLELEETRDLLVEEGLLTVAQAKVIIFEGYSKFYDYFYKQDHTVVETPVVNAKPLDLVEELEEKGIE